MAQAMVDSLQLSFIGQLLYYIRYGEVQVKHFKLNRQIIKNKFTFICREFKRQDVRKVFS